MRTSRAQAEARRVPGALTHSGAGTLTILPVEAAPSPLSVCAHRQKPPNHPRTLLMDESDLATQEPTGFGDRLRAVVTWPYLWGVAATLAFYWAIPHLPVHRELAERYFCAHPVEYVQTALFFVGLAILLRKLVGLRAQRSALDACAGLTEAAAGEGSATRDSAAEGPAEGSLIRKTLDGWLASFAKAQRRSAIARRLAAINGYVRQRQDGSALEQHLKDLEERADDELHDGYALLQTINWAIPIMGFLGTVLGITVAIAELDVNQLDASLSAVTTNLAVAFDTTAVALSHSLILVFLYLFVKRSEERVFAQVGGFCREHVLPLATSNRSASSPLLEAESAAARQLIERTGQLIDSQTQLWSDSIEALRERWTGTLDEQQKSLTAALASGTQTSLDQHADHLADLRGEFLQALEELTRQRSEAEAAIRSREAELISRWEAGSEKLGAVLDAAQRAADERNAQMLSDLSQQLDGWKSQLQTTTESLQGHVQQLVRQEELLCGLLERGGDVISLEKDLNENLQALRATETFEQTMHSLSAAVHLLTAHARQRAA